ncbi:hypothetical protein [Geodermatophilus sp. CPCC 206100]|uniref:hypothetical protein n=1 Tax=Geodermatophilus sp. CPCC 206100 TaxID=3020054 RepID=UPI003B00D352
MLTVDTEEIDPRYLHHLLRSGLYKAEIGRISRNLPPNGYDLSWEAFRAMPVALPTLEDQRRISGFLDSQVGLMESAISARERQMSLVEDRFAAFWSERLLDLADPRDWMPLRRFLRSITDGPFGSSLTSEHYSETGARVVRLGNLGPARFRPDNDARISLEYFAELRDHAVLPGDLLVAGLGDEKQPLGRACVAPDDLGPAIVKADCFRVRLDTDVVSHAYAAWAMSSPPVAAETLVISRGATRARINTAIARDVRIPVPARPDQGAFVAEMERQRAASDGATQALTHGLVLLQERQQSVITAALTGQLDVTTARAVA